MNKLQQIILKVIEEMNWGGVYGSLPASSSSPNNSLYNTDSYASGSNVITNPNVPIQKRTFPELINQKKKKKNGKQKQKQRKSIRKTNL
jgi:hypothetical protein